MEQSVFGMQEKKRLEEKGVQPILIGVLESVMNRYSVTASTLIEMVEEGWLIYEILKFCEVCTEKGLEIERGWELHQHLKASGHPEFVSH